MSDAERMNFLTLYTLGTMVTMFLSMWQLGP